MTAWPAPEIPALPGQGPPVRVYDSSKTGLVDTPFGAQAGLYVCGITPYDATHMGHAATYVTFDLLGRAWRDAGHGVHYVQNVTDVDDPLLERAARDGVAWEKLAADEIALFMTDMTALRVIPPQDYVGVVQSIPQVSASVAALLESGHAYRVPAPDAVDGGTDIYLDLARSPHFGQVSGWSRDRMLEVFAERGGDPDRAGKRDPLDPLLWRAERAGEPAWDAPGVGRGRPGWHIECTTISTNALGMPFDVQGGGIDLVFPHHEMSAVQGEALHGGWPFARAYVHQAMVGLDGEKMSKSKGNLVLVSTLRREGVDPMAIRLALLAHHYRTEWSWTGEGLLEAQERLARWRTAAAREGGPDGTVLLAAIRAALSDDLDSPSALRLVDEWVDAQDAGEDADLDAPQTMRDAVDALLGVRL